MSRPVTLFTRLWADLLLAELAPKVKAMGCDGDEHACWRDHFEADRAVREPDYAKKNWTLLNKHGLSCYSTFRHL